MNIRLQTGIIVSKRIKNGFQETLQWQLTAQIGMIDDIERGRGAGINELAVMLDNSGHYICKVIGGLSFGGLFRTDLHHDKLVQLSNLFSWGSPALTFKKISRQPSNIKTNAQANDRISSKYFSISS